MDINQQWDVRSGTSVELRCLDVSTDMLQNSQTMKPVLRHVIYIVCGVSGVPGSRYWDEAVARPSLFKLIDDEDENTFLTKLRGAVVNYFIILFSFI